MARETPHILLLDEPTNHLGTPLHTLPFPSSSPSLHADMESIDSLAKAINKFEGGMVLVSHDMRLISQVAKEIWVVDNHTVMKYVGEIADFKMQVRDSGRSRASQRSHVSLDSCTNAAEQFDARVRCCDQCQGTNLSSVGTSSRNHHSHWCSTTCCCCSSCKSSHTHCSSIASLILPLPPLLSSRLLQLRKMKS
jgi:ABC-type methionine transport system ATPase subunit